MSFNAPLGLVNIAPMRISLNDALNLTQDRTRPFDIKYVALDVNRKTGGEIIALKGCQRAGASHNTWQHDTIAVTCAKGKHPYIIHNHLILEVNGQHIFI